MSKALGDGLPKPSEPTTQPRSEPGQLRGSIWLTLHTADAVQVFRGRNLSDHGVDIPGLYRFARRLESIAVGSAMDDPFADLTLVRIERHLGKAERCLWNHLNVLEGKRSDLTGLTIAPAQSSEPFATELKLRSPHAFIAARLIGLFDQVLSEFLTLAHVGMLERRDVNDEAARMMRRLRRPFFCALQYRLTGVTRADVRGGTEEAFKARARHCGALPVEILDGSQMPQFSMRPKAPLASAANGSAVKVDAADQRESFPDKTSFAGDQAHDSASRVSV